MKTIARKNRGLTLIEVVTALGVIAVGLVGLLAIFPVGMQASARAADRTAAALLGEYVIEQIRLQQSEIETADDTAQALTTLGWDDYTYDGKQYTFNPESPGSKRFGSGEQIVKQNRDDLTDQELYSRYEVTLMFDKVLNKDGDPIDSLSGLKQVTVTIRWPRATSTAERKRQDTMTFVTYIRPTMTP